MTTKGTKEWAESNINFSKGCSNNCKYCYARKMASRFGWKKDWEKMENKNEMAVKKFAKRKGIIMSPSSHDITYSNVELAIKVFKNILKPGNNLLIVSKPREELIKKICNEISEWKEHVIFRFTIGTLDDSIRKYWEPGAPSIQSRIKALKYAYNHGWKTSISAEPYLDDKTIDLAKQLLPYVSDTFWIGPMNKIHVPKELWTARESEIYGVAFRMKLKQEIDKLQNAKIKYKDHFLVNLR
ncbi:MAG: radical SAM protein [Promethearchaeota archaeon]